MLHNVDWGTVIFQIVLALISSGGFSIFIKNHFDNKLNKSNHAHEKEMNKLKAKLESDTFISNKQYEKEFEIYQELWGNQIDCYSYYVDSVNCFLRAIENYITNGKADLDKLENNLKEIEKRINDFEKKSDKLKPFYNDKIYNSIREVSNYATNLMSEYGIIIEDIKIGDRNDVLKRSSKIVEYYNEMMRTKEQAAKDIREYLISLKVK